MDWNSKQQNSKKSVVSSNLAPSSFNLGEINSEIDGNENSASQSLNGYQSNHNVGGKRLGIITRSAPVYWSLLGTVVTRSTRVYCG